MAENIIDVQIDLINTNGRFRKDFGDIPALAKSIGELGLLQPIGIDAGYRLVFGERRLRAFKHLGRQDIPARFVNLESLLSGEYAENEFRKDFTMSERVEIGKALEGELAKRVGVNQHKKEGMENFPHPQGATRDLAAKAAGFGNGKTYEQAKAVVENAVPELIEAMDSGRVSVSAAATLSELPKSEQVAITKKDQKSIKAQAKKVKAAKRDGLPEIKPVGTPHVLQVINSMDILLRYAQSNGIGPDDLANAFLQEVDAEHPVIADRLKATLPMMRALGRIADESEANA